VSRTGLTRWDLKGLSAALFFSSWSKDPGTRVGAVVLDKHHRLVGMGYNGLPMGITDTHQRLHQRDIKLQLTLHAEQNALGAGAIGDIRGSTLYVWPFQPCSRCAAEIIQKGISRVICPRHLEDTKWQESFTLAREILAEAGVDLQRVNMEAALSDMEGIVNLDHLEDHQWT